MAGSQRARPAKIAAFPDLFHSVIQVDERTVVPKQRPGVSRGLVGSAKLRVSPVLCVLSTCPAPVTDRAGHDELRPRYDLDRREIWLGEFLLKRFTKPAENQESIPIAFEDAAKGAGGRWPVKILDPISGHCLSRVKRLHDALDALNAAILEGAIEAAAPCCIEFRSDGTGRGLCWKIAAIAGTANSSIRSDQI